MALGFQCGAKVKGLHSLIRAGIITSTGWKGASEDSKKCKSKTPSPTRSSPSKFKGPQGFRTCRPPLSRLAHILLLFVSAPRTQFPQPAENTPIHPFTPCFCVCEGYKTSRKKPERSGKGTRTPGVRKERKGVSLGTDGQCFSSRGSPEK